MCTLHSMVTSFFLCMQASFCVAMMTTLNGLKPVVELGNPLPVLNFLCKKKPNSIIWPSWPCQNLFTVAFGTMTSVQYVTESSPLDNQASTGLHSRFSVSLQPG